MMFGKNIGAAAAAERIPMGSVGVEIGVWRGDSSELFLKRAGHLHLVDPWSVAAYETSDEFGSRDGYLNRYAGLVGSGHPDDFQRYYDAVYGSVVDRFSGRPVTIHRCTSEAFFESASEQFDWVYIDGSHTFKGCISDLENCVRVVKSGGFILGDDYGKKPGVTAAVNEFALGSFALEVFGLNQYQISL